MSLPVRLKYQGEGRVLGFDFTSKLAAADTVLSVNAVTASPGLTLSVPQLTGNVVTVRVSGGSVGSDYTVACRVISTGGDTLELRASVEVRDDAN